MAYRDKPMQCPRCGKPLIQYAGRDKWRCKECNGALVGGEQLAVEIGPQAERVLAEEADANRPAIHPCPICAYPLTPYTIGTGKDAIELDRCVNDGVVWFDGGEIGKVRQVTPAPEAPSLLTNTLAFVKELREEEQAMRSGAYDDIPAEQPDPIKPGEWEKRAVCSDGGCNGVIGDDGKCHVCGRSAPAAASPPAG